MIQTHKVLLKYTIFTRCEYGLNIHRGKTARDVNTARQLTASTRWTPSTAPASNATLWTPVQNWAVKRQWRAHLHVKCHSIPPEMRASPVPCVRMCVVLSGVRERLGEVESGSRMAETLRCLSWRVVASVEGHRGRKVLQNSKQYLMQSWQFIQS